MFDFQYVELMNWAFWPTTKLPLDQKIIMISGPNGSGKTTFLDALRTLLRVPRLSAGRRFTDYLNANVEMSVVKSVVSNMDRDGGRSFDFLGFASDEVTLAVLMKRKSGRWEKRFIVLEGDRSLDDLRKVRNADMLTASAYSRIIHQAGCSDSLLKVLALEQGQTDKLCEKSPKELLDLLLDVHGDKEIIDRYKAARENYQSAHLEFNQLGARLAEEQAKLFIAEQRAEQFRRYQKLISEIESYESVLMPQAEYNAAKQGISYSELAIKDIQLRLSPIEKEILSTQTKFENSDAELERRKSTVQEAHETKDSLEKTERNLDIELHGLLQERKRLDAVLDEIEDAKPQPIEPIRKKLAETRRDVVKLELREENERARLHSLNAELQPRGKTERKIYPRFVSEFTEVLNENKIKHQLLCDVIEITDTQWQLAIESILGRDRFTVLVDDKEQLKARKLGEKFRYRGYIVSLDKHGGKQGLRTPARNSALSFVVFDDGGIPQWISDALNRTILVDSVSDGMKLAGNSPSVTRKGYRQDRRGGISIAVDHFYCGSLGQNTQKQYFEDEIAEKKRSLAVTSDQIQSLKQDADALEKQLHIQEILHQGKEAKGRKQQLDTEITSLNRDHKQALEAKRQAELKLLETIDDLNNFERECDEQKQWLLSRRDNQSGLLRDVRDHQNSITAFKDQLVSIEERLESNLLTEKALRDVPELDDLTPQLYAAKKMLEEYTEVPDEHAVHIFDNHKSQFEQQKAMYNDHQDGLINWEREFKLARDKYVSVVEHTIKEYRNNILDLAKRAGVSAEVTVPNLQEADDSLDEAVLQVRFGFDGKRAIDISGTSLSGGQKVVISLILLMSMTNKGHNVNRGGFFIIDEPFAHLSIERIDDISHFLEKSQCQFILTSPTTHNVNVFSAARLQLNFRIKKPNAEFAAVPTVIRR